MITDNETNFLYLADCLQTKHPIFFKALESILNEHKIAFGLLLGTKDIWVVDYMPIQVSKNQFVQFTYNPDYLQSKKWIKTISDVDDICNAIELKRIKSNIILDGGNVIKALDKVIMCDKIFYENPAYSRKALSKKLKELFEVDKLFFVPQQPKDYTGHADGIIRFVDDNNVIINNNSKEAKGFERALKIALDNAGINYTEIPYNPYNNKTYGQANGDYINFLQIQNLIIVPTFGINEDEIVVKSLEEIYKGQTILTIDSNEIADKGGIVNCVTWNIKV